MSQSEATHPKKKKNFHCSPHDKIENPAPNSSPPPPTLPMETTGEDTCLTSLKNKLAASLKRTHVLEEENKRLKQEVLNLRTQMASSLGAQNEDRKPMLWRKVHNSVGSTDGDKVSQDKQAISGKAVEFPVFLVGKEGAPRTPRPPPTPPSGPPHSASKGGGKEAPMAPPPPPPPPLPSKLQNVAAKAVRRVPEVIELYRAVTRRETRPDARHGVQGTPVTYAREMIGEIENRSTYLLAIKSDVETHGDFIRLLTKEVQDAAFRDISDVDAFVKWLDEELSYLVDERAVLKHFPQWPERKADAMREAACGYRDLKSLQAEVLSSHDDSSQPTSIALKRIQVLQDKLEQSVHNLERVRDIAKMRYRELQIPWEWMLDSGIVAQLKSTTMKLAKDYMRRVVSALHSGAFSEEEDLMLQGVRFAFRVHQFAGGFDQDTRQAFQELRKVASRHLHYYHTQLNSHSEQRQEPAFQLQE
uniref:Protein CHUP1, chloroplastic n=1 Tax=Anthurium amnicola TaxID=1678845 RepID=A0A1D1YEH3_9ARAE